MKICPKCNSLCEDSAYFCQECGAPLPAPNDNAHTQENQKQQESQFQQNAYYQNNYNQNNYYRNGTTAGIMPRNLVLAIVFSFLTCGIYSIYWMIKLNDEVQIDKENSFHYNVTNAADKEDTRVVVDDNTVATDIAAYVNNIFSTLPEGFFVNGKIEITKNVVVDGVKKTVDDKFYATVFDDSGKAVSTVELKQNDKVTVTVPFSEDIKDTVTYAVKETDKDGNVLDKDSFAYVVSGEGSVKLNESDQYHGSIEITNTKKDAAVTPGGSNGGSGTSNGGSDASSHGGSATSRPVKTGDPMNPAFWGLVLLVSVIVIAGGVVAYKKRKQK